MPLGFENSENICDLRVFIGKMNSILKVLSGVFSLTLLTLDCFSLKAFRSENNFCFSHVIARMF